MSELLALNVDEVLLNEALPNVWHVHSVFQHVINLSCPFFRKLLTITSVTQQQVPYGIYVSTQHFAHLKEHVRLAEQLTLTPEHLVGEHVSIRLDASKRYTSQGQLGMIQPKQWQLLLDVIQEQTGQTGFAQTLYESMLDDNHLLKQVIAQPKQHVLLKRLIGKGPGLTPSGDDMLVGSLLAMAQDELRSSLQSVLVEQLTTDVATHYLLCALDNQFGEYARLLQKSVMQPMSRDTIAQIVAAMLSFGHTSGYDTLAGFLITINSSI